MKQQRLSLIVTDHMTLINKVYFNRFWFLSYDSVVGGLYILVLGYTCLGFLERRAAINAA